MLIKFYSVIIIFPWESVIFHTKVVYRNKVLHLYIYNEKKVFFIRKVLHLQESFETLFCKYKTFAHST